MNWKGKALFMAGGLVLLMLAWGVLLAVSQWLALVTFFLALACFMIAIDREKPNG